MFREIGQESASVIHNCFQSGIRRAGGGGGVGGGGGGGGGDSNPQKKSARLSGG